VFVFDPTRTSRRATPRSAVVLACLVVVAFLAATLSAGVVVAVVGFWSVSAAAFVALLHFETHDLDGDAAESLDELSEADSNDRVAA
jgi:hypothetical protein